ncbi:MAG TPA: gamma-glutamyltransferase [Candidatus Limnocylindria bacterium]|jgi:gamma-glutamyltranspeptidase/glutathione hydrolase|nr:gamma-glutamyltransferase [Candidatus Limnocylindria bacterium]
MTDPARSEWRFTKSEAVSTGGMVTADPLAAEAGLEILRDGGNALDAALATAFALGVTSPIGSGLGGIAGLVVWREGKSYSFDGSTRAPLASRPDMFELIGGGSRSGMYGWPSVRDEANVEGPLSVSVPGAVAAYELAHRHLGKLPWARLFAPAIGLARDGFVMDWYGTLIFGAYAARLHRNAEAKRVYFRAGGAPYRPPTGFEPPERLVQPDLAHSLELIAGHGADALYRGELGAAIVDDVRAQGGVLSLDDFSTYEPGERPPLALGYRGHRVLTLPGLTGGPTVARALELLGREDLRSHPQLGAESLHRVAVALRAAFRERLSSMADLPNTTHVNAVDRDRMLVSLTATLGGGFGSGVMARGTGIVLTNGTYWFDPRPDTPNSIAPGKRVLWAGAPTIVLRADAPFLVCGAPGGRKIMSAVVQVIVNTLDYGDGPQDATSRPRVHDEGEKLEVDSRIADATRSALASLGHVVELKVEDVLATNFARPGAIQIDGDRLRGGVEGTKIGIALGY